MPIAEQIIALLTPGSLEVPSMLRPRRRIEIRMYPGPEGISDYIADLTERSLAQAIPLFNGAVGSALTRAGQPLPASLQQCAAWSVRLLKRLFSRKAQTLRLKLTMTTTSEWEAGESTGRT